MKTLVISASPREDGNSHVLARSAIDGARSAGQDVQHVFLDDYVDRMLDNCRRCRRADGSCSLGDRYEELLIDRMMPADGIIFAMPLYFYGRAASAQRKESSRNFRRSLAISAKTSSPSWSATPTAAVRSCPIPAIA